jgi:hypothetical protein
VHNSADLWTPEGGWIVVDGDAPYGYSVTRRTLDPILRELAAETPGVELLAGWNAVGLVGNARPAGVEIEDRARECRALRARHHRELRPRCRSRSTRCRGRSFSPRCAHRPHQRHAVAG